MKFEYIQENLLYIMENQDAVMYIKAYEEATKAIETQRRALCDILPDGIHSPEYIKEYTVRF